MKIEKTEDEILIRIPKTINVDGLQRIWNYLRFREIASKSKATQEEIDKLAAESKSIWWNKNKDEINK